MAIDAALPAPNWALWRELMASSNWPDTTREVGVWALQVLERELGASWPEEAYRRTRAVPSVVAMGFAHAQAYGELIELSLRLHLLSGLLHFPAIRDELRRDLRDQRRFHSRIELEVAGLALHEGLDAAFEAKADPASPPADLQLAGPDGAMLIEARVLLKDEVTRAADAYWDAFSFRLFGLETTHDVAVSGQLLVPLDGSELDSWFAGIEVAAREVAEDGQERSVPHSAGSVTVWSREAGVGKPFQGPALQSVGWPRVAPVLRQKAERAVQQGSSWLRFDLMDGLWQLTPWANYPLAAKVEALAAAVREELRAFPHIAGAVLTSGACLTMGGHENETYRDHQGNVGLRRLIAPVRVRETIVVGLDEAARRQAELWLHLYDREPGWIGWALAKAGLPIVSEVLAEWLIGRD